MWRLTAVLAVTLVFPSCRPRDKVRVEPTDESLNLLSEVKMSDPRAAQQLITGFHALEHGSWRWTKGKFAVTLQPPPEAATRGAEMYVEANVAESLIARLGDVTLTGLLNGARLGSCTWRTAGQHTCTAQISAAALTNEPVTIDFALDRFLPAGTADSRELGLIVSSLGLRTR